MPKIELGNVNITVNRDPGTLKWNEKDIEENIPSQCSDTSAKLRTFFL